MAIKGIEAHYLEIPLRAEFHPSWVPGLTQTHNRCLVVQVHDDSGHTGIGAGTVFEARQAELGAEWSYEDARAFCRAAGALGFRWVEEPRHRFDHDGLARLCAEVDVTIAGGDPTRVCTSSRRSSTATASTSARDAMLLDPPRPENGVLSLPAGPGIGCDLDPEALARWGTKLAG